MNESSTKIPVLLVDDDEDDYIIIRRVFAQIPDSPFVLSWCSSFDEAKELIARREHAIYLIDYRLGEHTGLELLEFAEPRRRPEPFILLTGAGDTEIERRSMKLAAADYLVKGTFKADLLSRTLYYALERKQIEQQRLEHLIEINKTKDEFISLASHQLRTPATGVKQYVGMVLEGFVGDVSEEQRAILQKAYESNERQLRIVSDLLKVAQVDAGKVRLRFDEVDLVVLVADVIKEQQSTIKQRSQVVDYRHPTPSTIVSIDKDHIRMVIENMLDNASKYSDMNKTIHVDVEDLGKEVRVRIRDQGVGIRQEDQDKLFGKFSRIHNPLSHHVGGTGLGLYWAKKIVDLHQGRIEVDSAVDVGTTFDVYLPKVTEPAMLETAKNQYLSKLSKRER
jgi:signal transduction histidine kinase